MKVAIMVTTFDFVFIKEMKEKGFIARFMAFSV